MRVLRRAGILRQPAGERAREPQCMRGLRPAAVVRAGLQLRARPRHEAIALRVQPGLHAALRGLHLPGSLQVLQRALRARRWQMRCAAADMSVLHMPATDCFLAFPPLRNCCSLLLRVCRLRLTLRGRSLLIDCMSMLSQQALCMLLWMFLAAGPLKQCITNLLYMQHVKLLVSRIRSARLLKRGLSVGYITIGS